MIEHEPERYELSESGRYLFDLPEVDRRDFLRVLTAMGGGLLVVASLPEAHAQESGRAGQSRPAPGDLASWVHIGADGRITAYTGKVEIGQNIRTSLSQVVADELRAPLEAIAFVMADTDLTPFDQGTFGSRTTPAMAPQLAKASAAAREVLIDLAASEWQVDRKTLKADAGRIIAADGRSAGYGDLTKGKQLTGVVGSDVRVAPPDQWAARGKPIRKVDGRDFVTGKHAYTPDLVRPQMLMGRVIRPDAIGAEPLSVDDGRAKTMPGVTVVRDGNFIGVVGPDERALNKAATAVAVKWSTPSGQPTSETIFEHLKKVPAPAAGGGGGRGSAPTVRGDVTAARAAAAKVFEASYKIPYIAHVPLEPRAAVAEWQDGKVTVWTGTQRPFGVRSEVAEAFRLPEDRVRVIVPDMGSGYGGKHSGEQAIEAARLAKAAGRPVKLVYTRAEEFMWAYFRPAGVIDIAAGVGADGRLVSWEFDNWNSGTAGLQTPYAVPNQRVAFHASASPLRQGSYRGLAATANHYAREMHMDAVARGLGVDPVEFRLKHITDARLRAVLTAAAQKSGWPRAATSGAALGIACGLEKGGYVATAAEVAREPAPAASRSTGIPAFKVLRLTVVFECGAIVNPDGLNNQVEGAIVQGLGGALFEAVTFAAGRILNGTMAQYRVPRFKDVPPIDVVLLNRPDLPSAGAGETPIVCVAPAIGSACRAFGDVPAALPVTLRG